MTLDAIAGWLGASPFPDVEIKRYNSVSGHRTDLCHSGALGAKKTTPTSTPRAVKGLFHAVWLVFWMNLLEDRHLRLQQEPDTGLTTASGARIQLARGAL